MLPTLTCADAYQESRVFSARTEFFGSTVVRRPPDKHIEHHVPDQERSASSWLDRWALGVTDREVSCSHRGGTDASEGRSSDMQSAPPPMERYTSTRIWWRSRTWRSPEWPRG